MRTTYKSAWELGFVFVFVLKILILMPVLKVILQIDNLGVACQIRESELGKPSLETITSKKILKKEEILL